MVVRVRLVTDLCCTWCKKRRAELVAWSVLFSCSRLLLFTVPITYDHTAQPPQPFPTLHDTAYSRESRACARVASRDAVAPSTPLPRRLVTPRTPLAAAPLE